MDNYIQTAKYRVFVLTEWPENREFNLNKNIIPTDKPCLSRLLKDDLIDSSRLNWKDMIKQLKIFI